LIDLEEDLLDEETPLPVYFAYETEELNSVYDSIASYASTTNAGSAFEGTGSVQQSLDALFDSLVSVDCHIDALQSHCFYLWNFGMVTVKNIVIL
jgi:hypothetical protein